MSLTDVMDDVDYTSKNFNQDEAVTQHPPWMTEGHFLYHLQYSEDAKTLSFRRDQQGEPLCSPRSLSFLSMQPIVVSASRLRILKGKKVPKEIYPALLTEAILQRSVQTVSYLVSTWPHSELRVRDLLPREDLDLCHKLTAPLEGGGGGGLSLCDTILAGLLNTQPSSKLQVISFQGLFRDVQLCRELFQLPVLWISPAHRDTEFIHSLLSQDIAINQEEVERYVERVNNVSSNIDHIVRHEHDFGPITVELDCHVTREDAAIGLCLQVKTPFNFRVKRLWIDNGTERPLDISVLLRVLQPEHISHLEVVDVALCQFPDRWTTLTTALPLMVSLTALSLPGAVNVDLRPQAPEELGTALGGIPTLCRLNLACCNLRDSLQPLLHGMRGQLRYLSVRDCHLTPGDLEHLATWLQARGLQELNLSRNSLAECTSSLHRMLSSLSDSLVCLSLAYCCLESSCLLSVAQQCQQCRSLKVLAMQAYTPPLPAQLQALIEHCALVPQLQRLHVFPEAYAFPGRGVSQRRANRASIGLLCVELLIDLGRPELQLL